MPTYTTTFLTYKLIKMTKEKALQKLTASGYKVTTCMNTGNKIATKGQQVYKAPTINALINLIY
jgi:hypothetical protein